MAAMSQTLLMKELPYHERPRERLATEGGDVLNASELVAILLRTGRKGVSALDIGKEVIAKFRTLDNLSRASIDDLCQVKGIGRDKAVTLVAAFTLARKMAREMRSEAPTLDTPERIAELLREENRAYEVENFQVVLLNTRRKLLRIEKISQGTLDTILVHPREVFRSAILASAAAIVLVHNHPSGDPTPSEADIKVTRDLIRAGQLLKIDVLDHVIIGRASQERARDYVSLRELGYFYA
jgi:DNA repair protein RadC